jgi:Asp-tRNA(Asn)/Glu-tRNA(Gln) amidotransferase C subunit
MKIDKKTVEKIAHLSCLRFDDERTKCKRPIKNIELMEEA